MVLLVACNGPQDINGTYSSDNNGSIEITQFEDNDGEFKALNLKLPRLNNNTEYTTKGDDTETFTVYKQSGDIYSFRTSINGVAYIGTFDARNSIITINDSSENVTFKIEKR